MVKNKFQMIYQEIAAQIENGVYPKNSRLPSENELAEKFETSRETVRKALNLLSQNGYIQKIKAKGSIVLDIGRFDFPISGLVSFKEITERVDKPFHTIVYELYCMKPSEFIQRQLNLSPRDEVWKVVRSRETEGERIILDIDYFNKKYVPSLTKEVCEKSIYHYLEHERKLNISFARKEIVVEEYTADDQKFLDLKGYQHVVVVRNYVYLDNARLFQYTESRHRLDKFRFVDFARRSK
ncbi:trehalose operon repressor [Bacillota bacterium Lsc_1132]